ncbi:hypothetical protein WISP_112411 [Willisornis vidua]|uniref:Uncharacterized protein n=1 Tax=Willisornis vidua TaxID=1566151 RepID=A0ABQ9D0X1_9PASS|nr:hypothetical protein WISP_112411 [Willisornis vidua]
MEVGTQTVEDLETQTKMDVGTQTVQDSETQTEMEDTKDTLVETGTQTITPEVITAPVRKTVRLGEDMKKWDSESTSKLETQVRELKWKQDGEKAVHIVEAETPEKRQQSPRCRRTNSLSSDGEASDRTLLRLVVKAESTGEVRLKSDIPSLSVTVHPNHITIFFQF